MLHSARDRHRFHTCQVQRTPCPGCGGPREVSRRASEPTVCLATKSFAFEREMESSHRRESARFCGFELKLRISHARHVKVDRIELRTLDKIENAVLPAKVRDSFAGMACETRWLISSRSISILTDSLRLVFTCPCLLFVSVRLLYPCQS